MGKLIFLREEILELFPGWFSEGHGGCRSGHGGCFVEGAGGEEEVVQLRVVALEVAGGAAGAGHELWQGGALRGGAIHRFALGFQEEEAQFSFFLGGATAGGLQALRQVEEAMHTAARPSLISLDMGEFLSMSIPERGYLLSPILPVQGIGILYAPRGIGKTFAALSVAVAV